MTTYRCSANGHTIDNETFTYTLHVTATAMSTADVNTAWNAANVAMWQGVPSGTDNIETIFSTAFGLDEFVSDELSALTGKNVSQDRQTTTVQGTGTADPLPPEVAVAVSTRTGVPTRAGRGRFFLPAPTLDFCIFGRFDTSARDLVANAAQNLMQSLTGDGVQPVIYHRVTRTTTNLIKIDVGDVFDSQRRRRDKLKEFRTSRTI